MKRLGVLFLAGFLVCSCAPRRMIKILIATDPDGARIVVDGEYKGVSPVEVTVPVAVSTGDKVHVEYDPESVAVEGYSFGGYFRKIVPLTVSDSGDPIKFFFDFHAPVETAPKGVTASGNSKGY